MRHRLAPRTIRLRLVLVISGVAAVAVVASFLALHEVTGSDLRGRIDDELVQQAAEFEQLVPDDQRGDPASLEAAAQRFVDGQRYHPAARIFAIRVAGAGEVTNQREIIEKELEDERDEGDSGGEEAEEAREEAEEAREEAEEAREDAARDENGDSAGLLSAPDGLSTVSNEEAGKLRVLTQPIQSGGERVGTLVVADPLTSVDEALEELRNTFLVVGALTLALAVAAAIWLAGLITRPLRRIARVASDVDAGDLSHRIEQTGEDEVGVVADAFNRMLDRLETGFRRQREFISDASHELRSPLTVLRGRIELLARRRGDAETDDQARELLREVDRMDRLVGDLLVLARAERGGLIEPRQVPLADLMADLERDMPLLGARRFEVSGAPAGSIRADPDRLAQVLRNLVSNAVRHGGPQGTVKVSASEIGDRVRFEVADEGPGIPPDQLERVFDRFHRTDPGRGRDSGGSGLGLAIAKAIVEAHGGVIGVVSEPGAGASFWLELPREGPSPSAVPARPASNPDPPRRPPS